MTDQFERTPDLRGMPDRPADYGHPMAMAEALLAQQSPLCWNCNHGLNQHAIQNERSATACNRCRCSEFRQPPIHPEPEEGQGLANRVREMTSYPVVVVDQRWEVIA